MNIRKLGDKKPNVVLFQGSPRDKETCSGMDSKTEVVVNYLVEQWFPFINFKVIDQKSFLVYLYHLILFNLHFY